MEPAAHRRRASRSSATRCRAASVGAYQLQAAIAAVHDEAARAEDTDWPQIVALYGLLMRMSDNPMVALNHAIAVAMVEGPAAGLALLKPLDVAGQARGPLSPRRGSRAPVRDAWRSRVRDSPLSRRRSAHRERARAKLPHDQSRSAARPRRFISEARTLTSKELVGARRDGRDTLVCWRPGGAAYRHVQSRSARPAGIDSVPQSGAAALRRVQGARIEARSHARQAVERTARRVEPAPRVAWHRRLRRVGQDRLPQLRRSSGPARTARPARTALWRDGRADDHRRQLQPGADARRDRVFAAAGIV